MMALSAAMVSGCSEMNLFGHYAKRAVSEPPPVSSSAAPTYKIGKPYQVKGVWYYPQEDFDYDETGIASWYGPDFHGKLTANGEMFDQNAVSAAHKTLPMPAVVRVTNLENGRSLVVRVNDRGPFANGRVIDMSRRAAQLLGFEGQGTAKVRVQVMSTESRALAGKAAPSGSSQEPEVVAAPRGSVQSVSLPPPGSSAPSPVMPSQVAAVDAAQERNAAALAATERELAAQEVTTVAVHRSAIFVQAGSFSRHDNALRLTARLSSVGTPKVEQVSVKGKTWYRVRFGPISSLDEADRLLESVIAAGQQDARVIVD
mgnify:CR=1 FL=1